jgi:hypothetical protein
MPALREVVFAPDSRLRRISGFRRCIALRRIEIPAPVELIDRNAFSDRTLLTEVVFPTDSRLRTIDGFIRCCGLAKMEIPASVQRILPLWGCTALRVMVFRKGSRIGQNLRCPPCQAFIIYEDEEALLRQRRREHLRIVCQGR